MKIRLDIDKLALPGPGAAGGWTAPLPARATERREAAAELTALGLAADEIDWLSQTLEQQRAAVAIVSGWPSKVNDHAVLTTAATLAEGLAQVLAGASPHARAEMDTAALLGLRDPSYPRRAATELAALANALKSRIGDRPKQARRQPATYIVRAVATIGGARLGPVTHAEGSTFRRAAIAAFALAGQHTSPDRAIQEYRKSLNDRLPETGAGVL